MLACDFYRGVVTYKGIEFAARHDAIVDDDLFARVQARKGARTQRRTVDGAHGLLQGRIRCATCGQSLQSDRTVRGEPLYRERHSKLCPTNGRSALAKDFDQQVEAILGSLELPDDWIERIAGSVASRRDGPTPTALRDRLRRTARIYRDGYLSDAEYERTRADIEAQLARLSTALRPGHDEVAALFRDVPALWSAANADERHRLTRLLFERVYVDLNAKLIAAIVPTAEFGLLLQHALEAAERSDVMLVPPDHTDVIDAWHAYANAELSTAKLTRSTGDGSSELSPPAERLEMVETGENRTPRPERT